MKARLLAFAGMRTVVVLFAFALMYLSTKPASAEKTEPMDERENILTVICSTCPTIRLWADPCPDVELIYYSTGTWNHTTPAERLAWAKEIRKAPTNCVSAIGILIANWFIDQYDRTGCKKARTLVAPREWTCEKYADGSQICAWDYDAVDVLLCPGGRWLWEDEK